MEWHIRKVDEELGRQVKASALAAGVSVQAFIVAAVEAACSGTVPARVERSAPATVEARAVRQASAVERVKKVVREAARPDYINMSPSAALRAMREAKYGK